MQNVQRLVLYVGALLLAVGTLREPGLRRAVEPALAAGAAIVIGYGLSGRLLPDLVHAGQLPQRAAGGSSSRSPTGTPRARWPRSGSCCARGSPATAGRPRAMRLIAAAAAPALAAGLYLSYSRGALAVAVLGLLVLAALAPSRAQLRAAAVVLGCVAAAPARRGRRAAAPDRARGSRCSPS